MYDYITSKEAAQKWGISDRRVQILCSHGRICGARKHGWSWAIPADAGKPLDARHYLKNSGASVQDREQPLSEKK